MKSIKNIGGIFMATAAILTLSVTAGYAKIAPQSALDRADVIILTENHARTIGYDLDATIGGAGGLHALYLFTSVLDPDLQTVTLQIIVANANAQLAKGDEIIYFVAGFVGMTPFFQYVYATGGAFSAAATVPRVTFGVLFTGVVYTKGVDFPVTMTTTVTLQAQ
jgi:hypothetical protein